MVNQDRVRRFLILTSDSGFGHRSAANSIAKALQSEHPEDSKVWIVNPIEERYSPTYLRRNEHNYDRMVVESPEWYRFTYEISDSRVASSLVEGTLVLSLYQSLKQVVSEVHPDVVLTTTEMFNAPMGALRRYGRQLLPFHTVITDLADLHAMWFNPSPDLFYVANETVKAQAVAYGIAPERVVISGIPVDIRFARKTSSKKDLRVTLGIDESLPTFLFVGSKRVDGIFENLEFLEYLSLPFQVVVITGGDDALYAKVTGRAWRFPLRIEKLVDNMPEWMSAADILVTKAGGLILSEAMAAGLPVIMIDNLPGQESGNVRYILEHRAGARVEEGSELLEVVREWLSDDRATLQAVTENARKLGHPASAIDIAQMLWQSSITQQPLRTFSRRIEPPPLIKKLF